MQKTPFCINSNAYCYALHRLRGTLLPLPPPHSYRHMAGMVDMAGMGAPVAPGAFNPEALAMMQQAQAAEQGARESMLQQAMMAGVGPLNGAGP